MSEKEKLAEERADEIHAGDFGEYDEEKARDNVTADRDTNGISASMVRLGDTSGVGYDEKLDDVSVELHSDK